jgi:hypothetical protein
MITLNAFNETEFVLQLVPLISLKSLIQSATAALHFSKVDFVHTAGIQFTLHTQEYLSNFSLCVLPLNICLSYSYGITVLAFLSQVLVC